MLVDKMLDSHESKNAFRRTGIHIVGVDNNAVQHKRTSIPVSHYHVEMSCKHPRCKFDSIACDEHLLGRGPSHSFCPQLFSG
jgi:hypothetical protein